MHSRKSACIRDTRKTALARVLRSFLELDSSLGRNGSWKYRSPKKVVNSISTISVEAVILGLLGLYFERMWMERSGSEAPPDW